MGRFNYFLEHSHHSYQFGLYDGRLSLGAEARTLVKRWAKIRKGGLAWTGGTGVV